MTTCDVVFYEQHALLLSQQNKTGIGIGPDSLLECESLACGRLTQGDQYLMG